jgi:hypothetical protein
MSSGINNTPSKYTSVTEVATYGKDIQKFFTKDHATRGILIHELCENVLRQQELEDELRFLSSKRRGLDEVHDSLNSQKQAVGHIHDTCMIYGLEGFCESVDKMKEAVGIIPIVLEKRFFNESVMLCGRIDVFGHLDALDTPGIIDFKTSHNTYPEWDLQLAGYWLLCEANGITPNWAATVRLRRHGKVPITNVLIESREQYKEKCDEFLTKLNNMRSRNDKQSDLSR